jgi:hypothetical protein
MTPKDSSQPSQIYKIVDNTSQLEGEEVNNTESSASTTRVIESDVPMDGQNSELIDAKIAACEARGEVKLARLEGKIDVMIANQASLKDGVNSVKNTVWTVGAIVVTVIVASIALVVALVPPSVTFGTQMRDMVQREVESQKRSDTPPKAQSDAGPQQEQPTLGSGPSTPPAKPKSRRGARNSS